MEVSIIGAGSWATAIASSISEKVKVLMYARNINDVDNINKYHVNKKYFKSYKLSENIKASNYLDEVLNNKIIINAIPTQSIRGLYENHSKKLNGKIFINLSKGIELKTYKRVSEVIKEINNTCQYAILTGPSHAEEVIEKMPTALVCASDDEDLSLKIQKLFSNDYLRIYTSNDLVGAELAGAMKNVLAFGIGMTTGLGFGDNTKAAIMTRGIYEMTKFATSKGALASTINGLCGIGDLIVTATSLHSRNNRCGILVGQGLSLNEACNKVKTVVEGIPTTKALYSQAIKEGIDLPITSEIYKVLYEGQDPIESVSKLMNRDKKSEY